MASKTQFTVTGPEVEKPVVSASVGLSAATTFASRATEEVTFYVRDAKRNIVGYAERTEDGIVYVKAVRA